MDKANAAEWLLRRVVDPIRASELIGDQLEAYPTVGRIRFWVSIAQLMLRFSRRNLIGVAASPVLGLCLALGIYFLASFNSGTLSDLTVFHVKNYLLGVSILLWMATVFSLVRLGWRSTLTGVALLTSILWSLSLCFPMQWTSALVLLSLWIGFTVYCLSSAERRRALGIVCSAVVAAWLTAYALSTVFQDPHSTFGKWQFVVALFLVPTVESSTTMFLHRKFIASVWIHQ